MGEFKALLTKNFIIYRRSWFGSFIEVFVPVFFMLSLFLVRRMFPPKQYPAYSDVKSPLTTTTYQNLTTLANKLHHG